MKLESGEYSEVICEAMRCAIQDRISFIDCHDNISVDAYKKGARYAEAVDAYNEYKETKAMVQPYINDFEKILSYHKNKLMAKT